MTDQLLFVALVPPQAIQDYATEVKEYFAKHYDSRHALKSPPHITLFPPFKWAPERVTELERSLSNFANSQSPIPITLEGFSAFPPRVIYIDVHRTEPLLNLRQHLLNHLESTVGLVDAKEKSRPFAPHMTVGFRDLTKQNFKLAWAEFRDRKLYFEFTADHLTLLVHNGQRWTIQSDFKFAV